jgi:hypothetical protein
VERTGLGYVWKAAFEGHHCLLAWSGRANKRARQSQGGVHQLFKTFPDNHLINHPYKVEIAQGEWTCTVADFRGTMTGPMTMAGGTVIQPTNKSFHVDFCTVARWNEQGQIVEENLFYDLMGMLKQIGLMPSQEQKAA